jgi:hypothetical protein
MKTVLRKCRRPAALLALVLGHAVAWATPVQIESGALQRWFVVIFPAFLIVGTGTKSSLPGLARKAKPARLTGHDAT